MKRVMGYRLWVMGWLILVSFPQTGCTRQTDSQAPKNLREQEREQNPDTWDFGKVKEGEVLKHNFILKNESDKSLAIKEINTSCGCTASKAEKSMLSPGEKTEIEVKFNSKGYSGPTQQYVYVHTDSLDASAPLSINGERNRTIDNPIIRLIIKAEVVK